MKKIPFYNPASPFFFHFFIFWLFILSFVLFSLFSFAASLALFNVLYPFFALAITGIIRRSYINVHQAQVPEDFANKLLLYKYFLITPLYIFSLIGWGAASVEVSVLLFVGFPLIVLNFLSYVFILPVIIRLILLERLNSTLGFVLGMVIVVIFSFSFPFYLLIFFGNY